jgi:DNA-binding response OmpR family regulator
MNSGNSPYLQGTNILVVEDEQPVATLIREVLTRLGAEIHIAETGQAALDAMTQNTFDLVLLDVVLPDISGVDILLQIQASKPKLSHRTILMTGAQYHIDSIRQLRSLAVPTLYNPFTLRQLRSIVSETLSRQETAAA